MKLNVIKYEHHGKEVCVQEHLKGKHREHCLCYSCELFKPDTPENCKIADAVYKNCVDHDLVTPVWECPEFVQKEDEES